MEYINYLITLLRGSLSNTSNVLDNFEHKKCGKLLQTAFHVSLRKTSTHVAKTSRITACKKLTYAQ